MFQKSKHFLGFLAACLLLSSFGGAYFRLDLHLVYLQRSGYQRRNGRESNEVYKTILKEENGVWDGEETRVGYATLQYFPGTSVRAIDVSTWSRTL